MTGDGFMDQIKAGTGVATSPPLGQPAAVAAAATNPLADRGEGDLFWDIVKGRVDTTPPPIGELGGSSPQDHISQSSLLDEVRGKGCKRSVRSLVVFGVSDLYRLERPATIKY